MNCPDCGTFVTNLHSHSSTDKCGKVRELNAKALFKCRKCFQEFEKVWHVVHHRCAGDVKYINPEIISLRAKVELYEQLFKLMGVSTKEKSEVGVNTEEERAKSEASNTEDDQTDDCETEGSLSLTPDTPSPSRHSPSRHSPLTPIKFPPSFEVKISTNILSEFQTECQSFLELSNAIKKNLSENELGENYCYLFGEQFSKVISNFFPKVPESVIIKEIEKNALSEIINDPINRDQFIAGMIDSFCDTEILMFILLNFKMIDSQRVLDIKKLRGKQLTMCFPNEYLKVSEIVELFNLFTFTFSEIGYFIDKIICDDKMGNCLRYSYHDSRFFRHEKEGWVQDYFLHQLTHQLTGVVISSCSGWFRKIYKEVYTDNNYREGWSKNPLLKSVINLYKNVEICSTTFDLYYILQKKIRNNVSRISGGQIDESKETPQADRDEFALMSSRINMGLPGYEIPQTVFEIMFDDFPLELNDSFMKKYIGGLGTYKNEFIMSARFRQQVMEEMKRLRE